VALGDVLRDEIAIRAVAYAIQQLDPGVMRMGSEHGAVKQSVPAPVGTWG
jgi:hypothetical protein